MSQRNSYRNTTGKWDAPISLETTPGTLRISCVPSLSTHCSIFLTAQHQRPSSSQHKVGPPSPWHQEQSYLWVHLNHCEALIIFQILFPTVEISLVSIFESVIFLSFFLFFSLWQKLKRAVKFNYSHSSWSISLKQATQLKHRSICISIWVASKILCRIGVRRNKHLDPIYCCHVRWSQNTYGESS